MPVAFEPAHNAALGCITLAAGSELVVHQLRRNARIISALSCSLTIVTLVRRLSPRPNSFWRTTTPAARPLAWPQPPPSRSPRRHRGVCARVRPCGRRPDLTRARGPTF